MFVGSGSQNFAKLYHNGKLCAEMAMDKVNPQDDTAFNGMTLFKSNKGSSVMDELKIYNSLPGSDEDVERSYREERKKFMS